MDISLLDKYKNIKVVPTGSLFELELYRATHENTCPYCFKPLKEMRNRPLRICPRKTCPCRIQNGKSFIVKK